MSNLTEALDMLEQKCELLIKQNEKAVKRAYALGKGYIAVIPKVIKDADGAEACICPKCAEILKSDGWRARYCPNCGVKIYWEEEND